jgi:hypothetical protein
MSVLQSGSITGIAAREAIALRTPVDCATKPWIATTVLLTADLAALTLAAAASLAIWHRVDGRLMRDFYLHLWPVLLLFPAAYSISGLYPGYGRNPADELRKLCAATSVVYPALAVTIFLLKDAPTYSRGVFVVAWTGTLLVVPLLRALMRSACARLPWWGYPVAVAGPRPMATRIADLLERQPILGLKPVAVFEDPRFALPLARDGSVRRLILAMPHASRETMLKFLDHSGELFSDVIVIPDLAGF